jgi:hypothetical protein
VSNAGDAAQRAQVLLGPSFAPARLRKREHRMRRLPLSLRRSVRSLLAQLPGLVIARPPHGGVRRCHRQILNSFNGMPAL